MNGERLEFSGLKPFAGTSRVSTSLERIVYMSTKRNRDQEMNPSRASREGDMTYSFEGIGLPLNLRTKPFIDGDGA